MKKLHSVVVCNCEKMEFNEWKDKWRESTEYKVARENFLAFGIETS